MTYEIQAVVEGHGEVLAVPAMLDRWFKRRRFHNFRAAPRAVRAFGHSSIKAQARPNTSVGIEHWVSIARTGGAHGILVVVDAETDCDTRQAAGGPPLGPELRARAEAAAGGIPVAVVVADHEFESWFLAHERPFRAAGVLSQAASGLARDVDSIGEAKGTLRSLIVGGYEPRTHQPQLAARMSFSRAALGRSRSLTKLNTELERLSQAVRKLSEAP